MLPKRRAALNVTAVYFRGNDINLGAIAYRLDLNEKAPDAANCTRKPDGAAMPLVGFDMTTRNDTVRMDTPGLHRLSKRMAVVATGLAANADGDCDAPKAVLRQ